MKIIFQRLYLAKRSFPPRWNLAGKGIYLTQICKGGLEVKMYISELICKSPFNAQVY